MFVAGVEVLAAHAAMVSRALQCDQKVLDRIKPNGDD